MKEPPFGETFVVVCEAYLLSKLKIDAKNLDVYLSYFGLSRKVLDKC